MTENVTFYPSRPAADWNSYVNQITRNYSEGRPLFEIPEYEVAPKSGVSMQSCIDASLHKPVYEGESIWQKIPKIF